MIEKFSILPGYTYGLAHLSSLPSQNKYGYFEIIDPNQRFNVNKSLKEGNF
jgi:hypothetical protein